MALSYFKMAIQTVLFGLLLTSCFAEESEEVVANITVSPSMLKMQTGQSISVVCSLHADLAPTPLTWLNPNKTDVNNLNDSRISHDGNGTLTITDTRTSDSGIYECTAGATWRATADITIYVMPSYFMEGLVILGINGALLVVFLGCLAHSQIKQRKANKGQKYTEVNRVPQM